MAEPAENRPSFLSRFTVLRGAVRELWIVFAAKVLAIVAYGVMNMTLVLWLSSDLGYSDKEANSIIIPVWSGLMTFFTVLVGSLVDASACARPSCWASRSASFPAAS